MLSKIQSRLSKITEALLVLDPKPLADTFDSRDLAGLTDLSPKQVSSCISILKAQGYLVKVSTLARYPRYVRTLKPLKRKPSSIARAYRSGLKRRKKCSRCSSRRITQSMKNRETPFKTVTTQRTPRLSLPASQWGFQQIPLL